MAVKRIVSPGDKFNRWTAIRELPRRVSPGGQTLRMIECACDCGTVSSLRLGALVSGATKSCGCLAHERTSARNRTHGLRKDPLYITYAALKGRCCNVNNPKYPSYGGRGIRIWSGWRDNPEKFIFWIIENLGRRPKGTSLDRIDNGGDYAPGNLRWATRVEQANNVRTNVLVSFGEETLTIAQLAKKSGVPYDTLHSRLQDLKWEVTKATQT